MKRIIAAGLAFLLMAGAASAAITTTQKQVYSGIGPFKVVTAKLLMDESYLLGGETFAKATLGLKGVIWATVTPDTVTAAPYECEWDWDNELIIASLLAVSTDIAVFSVTDTLTAVTSLPDSTGLTIFINPAATSGTVTSAIVASTTNLTGIKFKITAMGW